jgi:palmitoyltransferase
LILLPKKSPVLARYTPLQPHMVQIVDRAINRIGPVFIAIALVLLTMCILCYYLVVFPYTHRWSDAGFFGKIYIATMLAWSVYMVYCIFFHYYMAIVTSPGNVLDRSTTDSRLRSDEADPSFAESHQQVRCPHNLLY